jgi:hypothetical protein
LVIRDEHFGLSGHGGGAENAEKLK